jgi:hypothetical protein
VPAAMREEHVHRTLLRVADLNSTIMLRSSTFLYAQDCAAYRSGCLSLGSMRLGPGSLDRGSARNLSNEGCRDRPSNCRELGLVLPNRKNWTTFSVWALTSP